MTGIFVSINMEDIWVKVKKEFKNNVSAHSYRMWIDPLNFKESKHDHVTLVCPNNFLKNRIKRNYADIIEDKLHKTSGKPVKLKIETKCRKESAAKKTYKKMTPKKPAGFQNTETQLNLPGIHAPSETGRLLRKNFTFDNFVVGGNNNYAYSAALFMASQKQTTENNSLFLLSKTGMGKSHLSQAVGHHILKENPGDRVMYATAEDFTNEMVNSFQTKSTDKFKEKYRNNCDVLLLEDVHFLTGKERTQEELAMTLDYLFESDKKIIFSSCYLPGDIPKMNDQLKSRLSCGLISKIERPEYQTRLKILKKKVKHKKYNISLEMLEYIASELTDDIRQLEGGLGSIVRRSHLTGDPITRQLVEEELANYKTHKKSITIDVIKNLVASQFNMSVSELVSASRKRAIVRPRQMAIYLSKRYTDQPLQSIGRSFNRYHATAIHSISAIEKALKIDVPVKKQIDRFKIMLDDGQF